MSFNNPPTLRNNEANSIFNISDYTTSANDSVYLRQDGGTMTGPLTVPSLTVNTNAQINTNVGLPTSYASAPSTGQLGGTITQTIHSIPAVLNTVTTSRTITLPAGVWSINYRIALTPTTGSGTVTSFIFALSTSTTDLNTLFTARIADCAIHNLTYSATAAPNYQLALMGQYSTVVLSGTLTLYLNYLATYAGTTFYSAGLIQAIRVG